MKRIFRNNKYLAINIAILAFVKLSLIYPTSALVSLINAPSFSKEEVVHQTNIFRSSVGQPNLKINPFLESAASDKLADMITNQYFAHVSPQGVDPWYWLTENNYSYVYAGENLAIGFFDATDTVQAWANSPSHRKNMLSPNFSEIGVAVQSAKIGELEGIVVVQFFGNPLVSKVTPTPQVISIIQTPTPNPIPTTIVTATPKRSAVITPMPSQTNNVPMPTPAPKEDPVILAYIKDRLSSSPQPDISNDDGTVKTYPRGHNLAVSLDRVFLIYAGIIALFSVILIMVSASHRLYWPFAMLHVIIFLSALLVEPVGISRIATIL